MEITQDDMQTIINAVLSSIRTNARTIEQLTPVTSLNNDDSFEINGGKRVTYAVLKGMLDNILNVVHDLGNMASVEAAMNAAKAYAVVSKQNTRIIVWTHENDAGIIFQTHIGMENARQFALLDGSPAKCKVRHLTINITDHTVADGGWQELITPVSFSYDSVRRAITANGPKNPGKEPTASWPVVTLPLGDSSHAGLMDPADKRKLGCIVDLGVVSNQAAAENAAAERTVTENSNVRIIMWRTGDNGRGDGGQIIQSRWGNYYVIQVMMFVGQEHSCRYRLITTGGNYSVGKWNDLIIPSLVYYDPGTHRVMYNGFLSGDDNKKTLFEIPVADDEELGLIRIGGPFYVGENDKLNIRTGKGITFDGFGNIQAKVNTAHGLDFYKDNSLAIKAGKGIGFEEDSGGITVLYDKGLAFDEDRKLRVNAGEGITFDGNNGGVALNIGTDTDEYKGLIFNEGSRTIGVYAGKGLTFNNYELVLNLADGGGLAFDEDRKLRVNAGEGITFDGNNGGVALNIGTDTDEYKGLIFNEGSRTIGVYAGKGLTFNNYELVLNLADGGGLATDGGKLKIEEGWRPVPQGKRSATPADNCFVYATDDPESKSSVLNAPDTLLKQKDGHLMFQKGMWNPNGEAIFYTRNQVPVATESCDGAMSSDDKRNLNKMLNPYNGSGLANLGNGICISTGAGIRINGDNELTLNLADGGGLVFDDYSKLTIDVPKLKEMLGLN